MPAQSPRSWADNPAMVSLAGLVLLMISVFLSVATYNQIKESRYIGRPDAQRDTITIQGEGRVTAVPDIGQITVSIVTENTDAAKAMDENTTKFNQLVEALRKAGVDKQDTTTSSYNVYPKYEWPDGRQILVGYEVSQGLTVKIRDLDKSGSLIALAGQNGANQVSGLSFTIDNPEVARQEAREKALTNALEKAKTLATQTGVRLGKIVSFSESSSGGYSTPTPIYYDRVANQGMGGGGELSAPSIEAGSQDIYVYATVQYEIF